MDNVVIERRKVGGDNELTKREAANLVDLGTAVLVGSSTVATAALAERTKTIPIVFIGVAEPLEAGFTDSLSTPSRNLTGFTIFDPEMGGKSVQLLQEIKPSIGKVTALFDLDIGAGRHVLSKLMNRWKERAQSMDLDFEVAHIKSASDIEQVFSKLGDKDVIHGWPGHHHVYQYQASKPVGGESPRSSDLHLVAAGKVGRIDVLLSGHRSNLARCGVVCWAASCRG